MLPDFDPPAGAIVGATVVLFNGPPYSGKDEAGRSLLPIIPNSMILKFAGPLKRSTHTDFGLPDDLPDDAFEDCKDRPHPAFFGLSPRNAYIDKSENRQKPFLGKDIYGRIAVRRMWREYQAGRRVFLVTDSGFAHEAMPVLDVVPKQDVLLIRVHADGRGCNFNNDSRSHIELPGVFTYDVENDGTLDQYHRTIQRLVVPFVTDRAVLSTAISWIRCSRTSL